MREAIVIISLVGMALCLLIFAWMAYELLKRPPWLKEHDRQRRGKGGK